MAKCVFGRIRLIANTGYLGQAGLARVRVAEECKPRGYEVVPGMRAARPRCGNRGEGQSAGFEGPGTEEPG